ncbi:dehydrogenase [Aggregicoccus sp. 17bor-14]|uniref:YciI family protein n=1 Tax=Myxococcaceae TaxID=31 RepID=UPI00129C225C|nr:MULTISPECIES: YciI family protein [Myxococcaceae]MBF5042304.1 dehydrogenase [Simulacricoccus sp. 17bor-14]MRI88078.1 dehydrogenase [Aggregicoccus sp. 17bor-14]
MAYMLLMVEPRGQRHTRTPEEGREVYARMVRWGENLKARGLLIASESLSLEDTPRVRVRAGKAQVVDGPFAEAKEMVGGFFHVACNTREEALALAAECPAAEWCDVEVRSLMPCYEDAEALKAAPQRLASKG